MRFRGIILCMPLSALVCMACTTLNVHSESWVAAQAQTLVERSEWRLRELTVRSSDYAEQVKANATAIYSQLLGQRTQVMALEGAGAQDTGVEDAAAEGVAGAQDAAGAEGVAGAQDATVESVLYLQVSMRETTSERNFERLRTILVESSLSDDSGRVVGRGLYIVEAHEGLVSAHLLYRVVHASLEVLR